MGKWPWPWQDPYRPGFFSVDGAYELAYAAPARARASGADGLITYLIAAMVRGETITATASGNGKAER